MRRIIIGMLLLANSVCFGNECLLNRASKEKNTAMINLTCEDDHPLDSIELSYNNNQWGWITGLTRNIHTTAVNGGRMTLAFKNNETFLYLSIQQKVKSGVPKTYLVDYVIEPGDQVDLRITSQGMFFSGTGAAKFQCRYEIEKAVALFEKKWMDSVLATESIKGVEYIDKRGVLEKMQDNISFWDRKSTLIRKAVSSFKTKVSPSMLELIMCDFLGLLEYQRWRSYNTDYNNAKYAGTEDSTMLMQHITTAYQSFRRANFLGFKSSTTAVSAGYLWYVLSLSSSRQLIQTDGYTYITKHFSGLLKDRLLTAYLLSKKHKIANSSELIKKALKSVRTTYCLNILNKLNSNLSKGAMAFNFSLTDSSGRIVRQEDLKGKVVLLDFYFTGCTGCRDLKKTMEKIVGQYQGRMDIAFVSVSIDKDIQKWKNGLNSHMYTHPGGIDLYTQGLGQFHPLVEYYNVAAYPTMILIDKKGKVVSGSPPRPVNTERERQLIEMLEQLL